MVEAAPGGLETPKSPSARHEEATATLSTLPDAAVHAITLELSPRSLCALRLVSRTWASDVARCLQSLSVALPASGSKGCCARHVQHQRKQVVAALPQRFSGVAVLAVRAVRPSQIPQQQRQQQRHDADQLVEEHSQISLDLLGQLPRWGCHVCAGSCQNATVVDPWLT